MQPEQLYFRGSMAQYWQVIQAEYQRLAGTLKHEPFKFELMPKHSESEAPPNTVTIVFDFIHPQSQRSILSIDAEYSRHRQAVWIMAHDHGFDDEEAHFAFRLWREIKHALKRDERLRQQQGKPPNIQNRTRDSLQSLCEIRSDAIQNGRLIPTKESAMQTACITYKTVKRYMPALLDQWDNRAYHPESLE